MKIATLCFLTLFTISYSAPGETLDMPSRSLGNWNGWKAACMVDPFEGPKCGVEKNLQEPLAAKNNLPNNREDNSAIHQSLPAIQKSLNNWNTPPELSRIWVTIDSSSTFLSFEITKPIGNGTFGLEQYQSGFLVRIDGNEIWSISTSTEENQRVSSSFFFNEAETNEIINEMKNGNFLYFRIKEGKPIKGITPFEKISLDGFSIGIQKAQDEYSKLLKSFPDQKRNETIKPAD